LLVIVIFKLFIYLSMAGLRPKTASMMALRPMPLKSAVGTFRDGVFPSRNFSFSALSAASLQITGQHLELAHQHHEQQPYQHI
jgi:hypothetical protein